jgi:hypothetical protein
MSDKNPGNIYFKQVKQFQHLLDTGIDPKELSKIFRNMYFEYTLLAFEKAEKDGISNELHEQLFYLIQIIKICDGDAHI